LKLLELFDGNVSDCPYLDSVSDEDESSNHDNKWINNIKIKVLVEK